MKEAVDELSFEISAGSPRKHVAAVLFWVGEGLNSKHALAYAVYDGRGDRVGTGWIDSFKIGGARGFLDLGIRLTCRVYKGRDPRGEWSIGPAIDARCSGNTIVVRMKDFQVERQLNAEELEQFLVLSEKVGALG